MDETLGALADAVARVTVMLTPFLPGKTAEVWRALGFERDAGDETLLTGERSETAGHGVHKITPLFPKPAPTQ